MSTRERIALGCCLAGFLLVVTSIVLEHVVLPRIPASSVWTREQAEARTAAAMKYHGQTFDRRVSDEELAETASAFHARQAEFESAVSAYDHWPRYCQFGGIAFALIGAIVYVSAKVAEDGGH